MLEQMMHTCPDNLKVVITHTTELSKDTGQVQAGVIARTTGEAGHVALTVTVAGRWGWGVFQ